MKLDVFLLLFIVYFAEHTHAARFCKFFEIWNLNHFFIIPLKLLIVFVNFFDRNQKFLIELYHKFIYNHHNDKFFIQG